MPSSIVVKSLSGPVAQMPPSEEQLAKLIKDIGSHRVMMGSDFPWYDLDHTVERVMELPLLSTEDTDGLLDANALNILNL